MNKSNLSSRLRHGLLPILVGAGTLVLSALFAYETQISNEEAAQSQVRLALDAASKQIVERFNRYDSGLDSVRSYFHAAGRDKITRSEFRDFILSRRMEVRFPGARGLGYIANVPQDREEEFLKQSRADGAPDFTIRQLSPHSGGRYVIQYIEPVASNAPAIGLDVASEDRRRAAAEGSARTGASTLTGPITIVQAPADINQSLLMFMPIYQEGIIPAAEPERLASALGWAYAPLNMREVIPANLIDQEVLHLTITDQTDAANREKIYESPTGDTRDRKIFTQQQVLELYGRKWLLELAAHPKFISALNQIDPQLIVLVGLFLALTAAISTNAALAAVRRRNSAERELRYQSIIDGSPVPQAANDEAGNITLLNRAFTQTFGYAREDIPTLEVWWPKAYPDPEYRSWVATEWTAHLNNARTSGKPFEPVELKIRTKTGATLNVLASASALNADFRGEHIVTLQDITERTRILEELKSAQHLAQSTLDAMRANICVIDGEGNILAVNAAWTAFARKGGLGDTNWTGLNYLRVLDNDVTEGANVSKKIAQSIRDVQTGRTDYFEFEYPCAVGDERLWFLMTVVKLKDGASNRCAISHFDITQRKSDEGSIRKLSSRLQLALDVGGAGIWEWDIPNDILTWDATMYRLYGLKPDEFGGAYKSWLAGLHPEDAGKAHAATNLALDGKKPYELEFRVVWPTGEVRWIKAQAAVQRDPAGTAIGMIGINRDITEEKSNVERLRQSERVEAIGQMTAGVAHDFNNLLAVISGNLDLIADHVSENPAIKRFISAAERAVDRGADLTQRLLSFARKQTLNPEIIDLCAETKNIAAMLRRTIPEAIALQVVVPSRPVQALVDKYQLGNALINLMVNARDAMIDGGALLVSIGIEERKEAEALPSGSYAVISVQDTGCGMSPEVLNKAFEPFFTTKDAGKGSGLGLSMVYGFMRQSKGKAELFSALGKGTTVKLLFPLVEVSTAKITTAQPDESVHLHSAKHKVLVVDDMRDVLEVMSSQLSGMGFKVTTASDGPSALDILKSFGDFDFLVTDIGLPGGMSGLALAEAASTLIPKIKVITMTGYNSPTDSAFDKPRKSWINLRKPVKRSELTKSLNDLLGAG